MPPGSFRDENVWFVGLESCLLKKEAEDQEGHTFKRVVKAQKWVKTVAYHTTNHFQKPAKQIERKHLIQHISRVELAYA